MYKKFNWLRMMEYEAINRGQVDFSEEQLFKMLLNAYQDARPGKRGTYDVQRVEVNIYDNLWRIAQKIVNRDYHPLRSEAFIVHDPVMREIFAASFLDRIVHHLLINIVMPYWQDEFLTDSYSCRIGKGTDYGVRRAAHHIAKQSENYTKPTYFVKMDIKGFFMSMNREKLLELAIRGVHAQFPTLGPLGRLAIYLWRQIIMDNPLKDVRIRGKRSDWTKLPRDKSLFYQNRGAGIVIGNVTSQLLSNIFLNQLDVFIVRELGYRHYGRYVDDFYVVVGADELERVKRDIGKIKVFLNAMGLTLHPNKTRFMDVKKGVPYLGHYICNGHIEMDKRYQSHYYWALRNYTSGIGNLDAITSYMGGCVNYGCRKMQQRIWFAAGQDYEI